MRNALGLLKSSMLEKKNMICLMDRMQVVAAHAQCTGKMKFFFKENADEMSIFEGRSYINGLLRLDR